jgi:hypothetical protein
MIPIRLAALYVLLTFAMATDAQARDLQLPCSKAKSKEGSVITFYPSEVSWHEIKELGEKILFTSRGVKTVVPPGCPDIGHFTDTFRLPTKEGPLVIIQRVCRQGRSGDERIFTYPEPKLGSSKRRWFTLTIKTFSGPPVVARLEFSKGLVAPFGRREYKMYVRNHEFSMPEDRSLYPRARAVIKKIRNPNDPEELFRAISNATSIREQKKIEHLLYNLGKRILPIVLKKLSDPDPQAKESALVLLRWLPAPLSIGPVATLLKSDSPRIAQQARYTLSILLLRLGKEIESNTTKRTLAVAVLEPFIRELLRDSRYSYSQAWKSRPRWVFLRSRKIFLLPFNVPELPDHTVDTTGLKLKESSRSRRPPQASIHFRYVTPAEWKSEPEKNHPGPALHFHKMKIAGRFARVAISGINDDLAHCNHDWVALFERVNSKWRLLEIERPGGSGLKGISPWMPPLPLREFGDLSPRQIEEF